MQLVLGIVILLFYMYLYDLNIFCVQGLIQELVNYNQRSGSAKVQKEVRNLLCLLTK